MTLKSDRAIEVQVDYESESRYDYDHEKVVVPESLLTKGDMKEAFLSAAYISDIIKEYDEVQKERDGVMEDDFKQTNHINGQLTLIAGVEIAVVLAAGLYQFFTLKNYLSTRQYI